jgi:hypothetical protein
MELLRRFWCHEKVGISAYVMERTSRARVLRLVHELLFSLILGSVIAVLLLHVAESAPPHSMAGQVLDWLQRRLTLGREYWNWFLVFSTVPSASFFLILQFSRSTTKIRCLIPGVLAVVAPFICWFLWGRTDFVLLGLLIVPTAAVGLGIYAYHQGHKPFRSWTSFWMLFSYFGFWAFVIADQVPSRVVVVVPVLGFLSCLVCSEYTRQLSTVRDS